MFEELYIESDGGRLFVRVEGAHDAPVLLLHHSLATNLHSWDRIVPALAEHYRVVRFDARGHGKSDAPAGPYDLAHLTEDVLRILDHLEINRAHFLGLSMGGMVGQLLGLSHGDRVLSLILASTTSFVSPEAGPLWDERIARVRSAGMVSQVEGTVGRWFTQGFLESDTQRVEEIARMIAETPVEGYAGWCEAIKTLNLTDKLGAITAPTLVIVGEEDPGTPVAAARVIHEAIANSQLVIIPAASHQAPVEQPEAFGAAVLGFIK
ncbi:MAG TPA: 3-oxoadipate enol-lactonase [Rhizobiales bacterium]|nr:3-oxoadipate enol-lactonase [Hyphomicrobiales bacterium]